MRNYLILMSATALAACGGGSGPESLGGTAPPPASGGGSTPTPSHSFVSPTETKTYQAHGAVQSYSYTYEEDVSYTKIPARDPSGNPILDDNGNAVYAVDPTSRTLENTRQADQLYTANASTVRNPGVTVSYDPRNAQFTLQIEQNGTNSNIVFQDPVHRTNFTGARTPQAGVPNLEAPGTTVQQRMDKGVQYLEADTGSTADTYDVSTFFYEKPGTTTKYVTYAGFVHNRFDVLTETVTADLPRSQTSTIARPTVLDRAAFVFGEQTANSAVPTSGSANFTGNMIASMVNTPQFDDVGDYASYFQWISGTASVSVNFGSGTVTAALSGTTLAPLYDATPIKSPTDTSGYAYPNVAIPAGATFTANGTAQINLATAGGFNGLFQSAQFLSGGTTSSVVIAGSTLDGAFYGPGAQEIGASFRIVGGVPDQRVDIIGSFTGAKGN